VLPFSSPSAPSLVLAERFCAFVSGACSMRPHPTLATATANVNARANVNVNPHE
jgi:hypothetical protein